MFDSQNLESLIVQLNRAIGDQDKVVQYINGFKKLHIKILLPDINSSMYDFTISRDGLRWGLGAIKFVSKHFAETIINNRIANGPFKDISDFDKRIDLGYFDPLEISAIIMAGAFDTLHNNRRDLLDAIQSKSLFKDIPSIKYYGNNPKYNDHDILYLEKKLFGLYISGHPLDHYKDLINSTKIKTTKSLSNCRENFFIIGIPRFYKLLFSTRTKRFKKAEGVLEDLYGVVPFIISSQTMNIYFENYENNSSWDKIMVAKANIMKVNDKSPNNINNTSMLNITEFYSIEDAAIILNHQYKKKCC